MGAFNAFRIIADLSHTASKLILTWAIHSNRSAEGVSLITQAFYLLVFVTRYIDLLWTWTGLWNFVLKLFYLASSAYILFLMMAVFPRTREAETAWRFGAYCLGGSLIVTLPATALLNPIFSFWENVWAFSIILESVCILPQLLLLRQTTVPTVIDSFYLVALGSYRGFYILNWIWRYFNERHFDGVSVVFGIVQTALYVDFAWVYYSRQRVKLRGGSLVDEDDLGQGWLVGRILGGRRLVDAEQDEEAGGAENGNGSFNHHGQGGRAGKKPQRWGARGISVSADDGVRDIEGDAQAAQPLTDPDAFEDESDQEETSSVKKPDTKSSGVTGGEEWRD